MLPALVVPSIFDYHVFSNVWFGAAKCKRQLRVGYLAVAACGYAALNKHPYVAV